MRHEKLIFAALALRQATSQYFNLHLTPHWNLYMKFQIDDLPHGDASTSNTRTTHNPDPSNTQSAFANSANDVKVKAAFHSFHGDYDCHEQGLDVEFPATQHDIAYYVPMQDVEPVERPKKSKSDERDRSGDAAADDDGGRVMENTRTEEASSSASAKSKGKAVASGKPARPRQPRKQTAPAENPSDQPPAPKPRQPRGRKKTQTDNTAPIDPTSYTPQHPWPNTLQHHPFGDNTAFPSGSNVPLYQNTGTQAMNVDATNWQPYHPHEQMGGSDAAQHNQFTDIPATHIDGMNADSFQSFDTGQPRFTNILNSGWENSGSNPLHGDTDSVSSRSGRRGSNIQPPSPSSSTLSRDRRSANLQQYNDMWGTLHQGTSNAGHYSDTQFQHPSPGLSTATFDNDIAAFAQNNQQRMPNSPRIDYNPDTPTSSIGGMPFGAMLNHPNVHGMSGHASVPASPFDWGLLQNWMGGDGTTDNLGLYDPDTPGGHSYRDTGHTLDAQAVSHGVDAHAGTHTAPNMPRPDTPSYNLDDIEDNWNLDTPHRDTATSRHRGSMGNGMLNTASAHDPNSVVYDSNAFTHNDPYTPSYSNMNMDSGYHNMLHGADMDPNQFSSLYPNDFDPHFDPNSFAGHSQRSLNPSSSHAPPDHSQSLYHEDALSGLNDRFTAPFSQIRRTQRRLTPNQSAETDPIQRHHASPSDSERPFTLSDTVQSHSRASDVRNLMDSMEYHHTNPMNPYGDHHSDPINLYGDQHSDPMNLYGDQHSDPMNLYGDHHFHAMNPNGDHHSHAMNPNGDHHSHATNPNRDHHSVPMNPYCRESTHTMEIDARAVEILRTNKYIIPDRHNPRNFAVNLAFIRQYPRSVFFQWGYKTSPSLTPVDEEESLKIQENQKVITVHPVYISNLETMGALTAMVESANINIFKFRIRDSLRDPDFPKYALDEKEFTLMELSEATTPISFDFGSVFTFIPREAFEFFIKHLVGRAPEKEDDVVHLEDCHINDIAPIIKAEIEASYVIELTVEEYLIQNGNGGCTVALRPNKAGVWKFGAALAKRYSILVNNGKFEDHQAPRSSYLAFTLVQQKKETFIPKEILPPPPPSPEPMHEVGLANRQYADDGGGGHAHMQVQPNAIVQPPHFPQQRIVHEHFPPYFLDNYVPGGAVLNFHQLDQQNQVPNVPTHYVVDSGHGQHDDSDNVDMDVATLPETVTPIPDAEVGDTTKKRGRRVSGSAPSRGRTAPKTALTTQQGDDASASNLAPKPARGRKKKNQD